MKEYNISLFYLNSTHLDSLFGYHPNTSYRKFKYISEVLDIRTDRITLPIYCDHHDHPLDAMKKEIERKFNIKLIE